MSPSLEIRSELSAQRIDALPNPMLAKAIRAVASIRPHSERAADQGCGKLRHLHILACKYRDLVLVDTERQLSSHHKLKTFEGSIREYLVRQSRVRKAVLLPLNCQDFAKSNLRLDVVYTVATYDVVPPATRVEMAQAARDNLQPDGLYVVIVPRNDSSILVRCTPDRRHGDGFAFRRNGVATFYTNHRDTAPVVAMVERTGFRCEVDVSVFRQVCLIFRRVSLGPNRR